MDQLDVGLSVGFFVSVPATMALVTSAFGLSPWIGFPLGFVLGLIPTVLVGLLVHWLIGVIFNAVDSRKKPR